MNGRDVWLESIKVAAVLVVLMALIGAFLFYKGSVDPQPSTTVTGTIVSMKPYNLSTLSGKSSRLNIRLEDGRNVEVLASGAQVFEKGHQVSIVEHRHDNGRITYTLASGQGH